MCFVLKHVEPDTHELLTTCDVYLQDVAPIAALIVASTNHVNAPVNGRHAVPRPLHRPVSTRCPTIGRWVEAVGLSEVRAPSAPRGDVHLLVQHRPCVSVHLEGRLKDSQGKVNTWRMRGKPCEAVAPSCGWTQYYKPSSRLTSLFRGETNSQVLVWGS